MTLGEKLKQLRSERAWSQPDMATRMGVEQSYLSKLENDKSLPSNDMLERILEVYDLDVGALVSDLDTRSLGRLRALPLVRSHLDDRKAILIGNRRRWLICSALFASFGAALIFAGGSALFFPDTMYQYRSQGVVLDGESREIFSREETAIPTGATNEERYRIIDEINSRLDEDYVTTSRFMGEFYNVPVEGG